MSAPDVLPDAQGPIAACINGELSPNLALMRLIIAAPSIAAIEEAIGAARMHYGVSPRLSALAHLFDTHRAVLPMLRNILDAVDHDTPGQSADAFGMAFDRAAAISPEAAVALYSLGDPALLAEATAELVARLGDWGVLGPARRVLDLGCGIGRLEPALAAKSAYIVGVEIAPRMLTIARTRCAAFPNVGFLRLSGRDLAPIADACIDLVLAVDSFPYVVQSGISAIRCLFAEAARILRPEGDLAIFNYSYRSDLDRDCREVAGLAREMGLTALRVGLRDLQHWDGVGFHLRKPRHSGTRHGGTKRAARL